MLNDKRIKDIESIPCLLNKLLCHGFFYIQNYHQVCTKSIRPFYIVDFGKTNVKIYLFKELIKPLGYYSINRL